MRQGRSRIVEPPAIRWPGDAAGSVGVAVLDVEAAGSDEAACVRADIALKVGVGRVGE
jgi:hypothetical protein